MTDLSTVIVNRSFLFSVTARGLQTFASSNDNRKPSVLEFLHEEALHFVESLRQRVDSVEMVGVDA